MASSTGFFSPSGTSKPPDLILEEFYLRPKLLVELCRLPRIVLDIPEKSPPLAGAP